MSKFLDDMSIVTMAARVDGAVYGQNQRDAEFRVVEYVRDLEAERDSQAKRIGGDQSDVRGKRWRATD